MDKKFLLGIVFSLLLGLFVGNVFYYKYQKDNNLYNEYNSYMLQFGIFNTKDELNKSVSNISNYMLIEKNNKYYVYLGVSTKKDNAKKLQEVFNDNNIEVSIKKTIIDNVEFISNLEQFDILLESATNDDDLLSINEVIISSYEEMVLNN